MRTVFMGSADFGVPALEWLTRETQVAGVVTQPDRPAGRGRVLTPPPIKRIAGKLGFPIIQPEKLRSPEAMAILSSWKPEVIIVAAYGQILRQDVLDMPPFGCLNLHASLLPRHRGAAPIPAAILAGDAETGVTLMKMDAGLDTGPILAQMSIPILPEEDSLALSTRLAKLGAAILQEQLDVYIQGALIPKPQDESIASYAPRLKKEEGTLDFHMPAEFLARKVRAFYPWPGAFVKWDGQILKIRSAKAVEGSTSMPIGTIQAIDKFPAIQVGDGWIILREVIPAGRKLMAGDVFLRGAPHLVGMVLS
jgi:methionyl-tRNA formyltransferase